MYKTLEELEAEERAHYLDFEEGRQREDFLDHVVQESVDARIRCGWKIVDPPKADA